MPDNEDKIEIISDESEVIEETTEKEQSEKTSFEQTIENYELDNVWYEDGPDVYDIDIDFTPRKKD